MGGKDMDKLDKKKKEVKDIIGKGEKLAGESKAPVFLGEKLAEMKKLWANTNNEAKQRLDDLKGNAGCWNTFAEKCALLQTHVTTAQKQIDDVKKLYDMPKAKEDFKERCDKATSIKASIEKTFKDVCMPMMFFRYLLMMMSKCNSSKKLTISKLQLKFPNPLMRSWHGWMSSTQTLSITTRFALSSRVLWPRTELILML